MRLKELYLAGFGHFREYAIDDISDNVTVFYGPNEAGKSTLLAFIRGILFGFPRSASGHYPPLSGGKHGGRITVSDPAGVSHTIERFGRTLNVRGPAGKAQDPKAVLGQLTGGITQSHFKNIFAFGLDELQRDDALDDSYIYSAGQGAPKLPALLDSLEERRREIYNSRARKKTLVTGVLSELREVDGRLGDIGKNAEDYGRNAARKDEVDRELETANERLARLKERLDQVDRLKKGWNDWVELENVKARLKEIPQFEKFPEDPIPRLDGFESRIRQAEEDRDGAKEELQKAEKAASAIVHGESLLSYGDHIEEIRRDRNQFDSAVRDLPERRDDLRGMEDELSELLGALGKEWNESNLHDIDISVAAKGQVNEQDRQLEGAEEAARSAGASLDGAKAKMDDLSAKMQDIQDRLRTDSEGQDAAYLEKLLGDRDRLDKVRGGAGSLDNSVRELPRSQGELDSLKSGLERSLSDLGRDWNADRLDAFDTSIESRQEVERFKKLLADAGENARLAGNLLGQENARLAECQNALREAQEQMPEGGAPVAEGEIDRQREALRTSRSRFHEYERARVNHENLSGQLGALTGGKEEGAPSRLVPISMLGVGGALAAAGAYLGDSAMIPGIAVGAALLGIAVYMLAARGGGKKGAGPESAILSRQAAAAKSGAEAARLSLAEAAGALDIDDPTDSTLDAAEARLSSSEKALSAWKEAHGRVTDARRALKSQELRTGAASQKAETCAESESKAQSRWLDWLEQRSLSDTLVPDTVIELTDRIKEAKSTLEQIRGMEQRICDIRRDIEEYLAQVQQLADRYGLSLDVRDHHNAKSAVGKIVGEFDRADKLAAQRDDVEYQVRQHGPAYDKAAAEEKAAAENLAGAQRKWHDWLLEHNARGDFTPKTMREFIDHTVTAVNSLKEVRRMRDRIATIEGFISEFSSKVEPLASAHGIPPDRSGQAARVADILIKKLEQARAEYARREEAVLKRDGVAQRLRQFEKRLQAARGDLEALLREGGAGDGEDFRRRAGQHGERMGLEQQRDKHESALALLSGPGEKMTSFLESLGDSDLDELRAEYDGLEGEMNRMEDARSKLQEERGRIGSILERLAGEGESYVLRRRKNILTERLLEHAGEWSQLVLAKTLLEMTQQKFERERQPDVIRNAQEFFYNITGKRYGRLYAPIGEKRIMVVDAAGNAKQPHELSRGTREQLYLALRFGLIRDLGERTGRLPVVIDEALVNFDPGRARLTAQSLDLLAGTNQILVFTCHPGMRDLFTDVAKARVVEIKND